MSLYLSEGTEYNGEHTVEDTGYGGLNITEPQQEFKLLFQKQTLSLDISPTNVVVMHFTLGEGKMLTLL